ncbi:MAG TPA: hypothetical protein VMM76_16640, partial [Pirellulaceae bacterium]|nr:hypothetical protein [Pirellulaceae bacterium]
CRSSGNSHSRRLSDDSGKDGRAAGNAEVVCSWHGVRQDVRQQLLPLAAKYYTRSTSYSERSRR